MILESRIRHLLLGILVASIPVSAHAGVVINEVAWMGTATDANDEWIELYNNGSDAVDVTGWTLSDGDALMITLGGTLGAGAYGLLERTDDAAVPSVGAFQVYTGALSNAGKTLTLKDATGAVADVVAGGEDWASIGGNNESKDTPQRTSSGAWVTAPGTPGSATVATQSAPQTTTTTTQTVTGGTHTAGGTVVRSTPQPPPPPNKLALSLTAPRIVYVHQPVAFLVTPSGAGSTIMSSLQYAWNFGDTYTSDHKEPTHSFNYPGDYVVVVDASFAKQSAQARQEITVLPTTLTLTRGTNGEIRITNQASYEVDIGGFTIQGTTPFVFPKHTIIQAGKTLPIAPERIGGSASATLYDASHVVVATLGIPKIVQNVPRQRATAVVPVVSQPLTTQSTTSSEPIIPTGIIHIGDSEPTPQPQSFLGRVFARIEAFFGFE